jgi:hypothetical protein
MTIADRDAGRLGKAVEHLVAATCILTSDSPVFADATTVNSQHRRRFVASAKEGSHDQWSPYRCFRWELAGRIFEAIDGIP